MTRNAAVLEAAYVELVDSYPDEMAAIAARIGSVSMMRRSMHILIRREQEGDRSVSAALDQFEAALRELEHGRVHV